MINKMIRISAGWDWVTPLLIWLRGRSSGGSVGFHIPAALVSGAALVDFLRGRGVTVYGSLWIDDTIILHVNQQQAKYTGYLLTRLGLPFTQTEGDRLPTRRNAWTWF